ncbi:MAG: hypothetical protein SGBAC_008579 [Bacillariaceae sp.]
METTQKKGTFQNRIKRRFVERMPIKENANLWYNKSDYAGSKKRGTCAPKLYRTPQDYSGNAENLSAQGIMTNEQMAMKNINFDNSIKAGLEEQEKQEADFFEANEYNDNPNTVLQVDNEEIAQQYNNAHSNVSLQQAKKRARYLAQNVKSRETSPEARPQQLSYRRAPRRSTSSLPHF